MENYTIKVNWYQSDTSKTHVGHLKSNCTDYSEQIKPTREMFFQNCSNFMVQFHWFRIKFLFFLALLICIIHKTCTSVMLVNQN